MPAAGAVRIFGMAPTAFRDWHRIGYVPQRTTFEPWLPVRADEVVATGLIVSSGTFGPFGLRGRGGRAAIAKALALVGMSEHGRERVGTLSAGQQQRVLIARAVVSSPELLILDEPTGGIDPETQTSFYSLLQHLNRERGVTLILVSHDVGVVAREVTKLACLNRRVIFCGRPKDYFSDERLTALYGASVRVVGHEPPCAHAG
jgi:zinc transport system ATP-binding protein